MLNDDELVCWDARLGVQYENPSAWARVVSQYLFGAIEPRRRLPHLAHAFRVLPYVPETPVSTFPMESMSDDEYARRVSLLCQSDSFLELVERLSDSALFPVEAATMLLTYLGPLSLDNRVVILALVYRIHDCGPFGVVCMRGADLHDQDERWAIVVRHRERVLAANDALLHALCDHVDAAVVARHILDAIVPIADEQERAIVFGYMITRFRVRLSREKDAALEHFSDHLRQGGFAPRMITVALKRAVACTETGEDCGTADNRDSPSGRVLH
ncbi:MAG: hypothetical protein Q7S96_03940 [bacterium]|nr:hypothetical protein [bacterium]